MAPEHLRPAFGDVFRQLQRGKALEPFEFYNGSRNGRNSVLIYLPLRELSQALAPSTQGFFILLTTGGLECRDGCKGRSLPRCRVDLVGLWSAHCVTTAPTL